MTTDHLTVIYSISWYGQVIQRILSLPSETPVVTERYL